MSLSGASNQTVSVKYATSSGTASSSSDYNAKSGTLIFAPGETAKTVTVLVKGDTKVETNETFSVKLSSATNATIADSQGVGTILNDDLPSITIRDAGTRERSSGTTTLSFSLSLSTSSSQTVTVEYATADWLATGGAPCGPAVDYLATSGTVSFAPGATSRKIYVSICGDRTSEPDETFRVKLSSPVNATIADPEGVGTIRNDD